MPPALCTVERNSLVQIMQFVESRAGHLPCLVASVDLEVMGVAGGCSRTGAVSLSPPAPTSCG